jgi:hypothetical protein
MKNSQSKKLGIFHCPLERANCFARVQESNVGAIFCASQNREAVPRPFAAANESRAISEAVLAEESNMGKGRENIVFPWRKAASVGKPWVSQE